MALMAWSQNMSVGINSIDDQHKKLIDYINELHEGMTQGKSKEALGVVLDGLINYTEQHFKFEEEIFAKTDYPDASKHKTEHELLKEKVVSIRERFMNAKTGSLSLEVMNFLRAWLNSHIQGSDKKYAPHFMEKGIK